MMLAFFDNLMGPQRGDPSSPSSSPAPQKLLCECAATGRFRRRSQFVTGAPQQRILEGWLTGERGCDALNGRKTALSGGFCILVAAQGCKDTRRGGIHLPLQIASFTMFQNG